MEAYAGTMYDAVLLYALAVNETLESGKSIRNGLEVSKKTYNRVYEGMIYSVFSSTEIVLILEGVSQVKSIIKVAP